MACLIVTDQIRIRIDSNDVAIPANEVNAYGNMPGQKSALQRPDMSRMRLAAMLRQNRKSNADEPRVSWAAMLSPRMAGCANSN